MKQKYSFCALNLDGSQKGKSDWVIFVSIPHRVCLMHKISIQQFQASDLYVAQAVNGLFHCAWVHAGFYFKPMEQDLVEVIWFGSFSLHKPERGRPCRFAD